MRDIIKQVYGALKKGAEEITPVREEIERLEADNKSGRYSDSVVEQNRRKIAQSKMNLEEISGRADREAHAIVEAYRQKIREADQLRGEDLTDDIKLLNCGVTLNESDIVGMLKRNVGNRTMQQLICRYAKEHDIGTGGYVFASKMSDEAVGLKSLDGTINMYTKRWIGSNKAFDMLNGFFEGWV